MMGTDLLLLVHESDKQGLDAFRLKIREFIANNLPWAVSQATKNGQQHSKDQLLEWHSILARAGLLVPHWPAQWGGCDWNVRQQLIYDEEIAFGDAPELNSVTFDMIGPILIHSGSDAQKNKFLPAIASGQQWWCQGYSEPNAGSDLASLSTRARRDGDQFVVNGSKIWTSYAQYADWMFCLVRTCSEGKPQEGISFLLIDMNSPGVTVRPIEGIHGWVVFNEVFLDNVRVPVEMLVGQENNGWTIAKSLLQFERLKLARIGENKRRMLRARRAGQTRIQGGCLVVEQSWFRSRYADLAARLMALEANASRFIARQRAGAQLGDEVSMLKMRGSRLMQLWEELTVDALGVDAMPLDPDWLDATSTASPCDSLAGTASSRRFLARGYTIAGGSSEVQHNILARKVLKL